MLRIIVISLVVANLLLLGFQSSTPSTARPETRPAPAVVKDSGIPTIHLFSEMMQDQGLLSGNRRCFTIGPFHSVADWDDVHVRLQKVATRISERQTEALVDKGYWVYMPPYASLLEANKALLSLQALGLKDVAIIYEGEWKNSISLGYFMRQENAQRRKQALEDRGFNPMMRIQRQSEPRFWLDYEQQPGSGLVELDMQNRPNDFMQRPVPCPEAEFLETDAAVAQDAGGNPAQAQAPAGDANPVPAVEEGEGGPAPTEQAPRVPDQSGQGAQETDPEPDASLGAGDNSGNDDAEPAGAGAEEKTAPATADETSGGSGEPAAVQIPAAAADETSEPPAAGEAVKTTGEGVGTTANEAPGEATGDNDEAAPVGVAGDLAGAEVEASPRQAVGTGPVDMVAAEPAQVEASPGDKDAETPAAGTSANETGNGGGDSDDESEEGATSMPSADPGEGNAPDAAEKDSGNGTVDG